MDVDVTPIEEEVSRVADYRQFGRVTAVQGLIVEIGGAGDVLSIGDRCYIHTKHGDAVMCEVVGFREGRALAMPFGSLEGVSLGGQVDIVDTQPAIFPCNAWLGRVVDALGQPVDGKGALPLGGEAYPIRASAPSAHARKRVGGKVDLGVRSINAFATCCQGQRMGIFSGSGVGKSTLMAMMARYTDADVIVLGLVGERGREAREFIEDDLGPEGMKRAVVVIATSDQPAPMRRQSAYVTLAVAEYFRNQGKNVLCLMDSVTRFAMAQREIGLSAGEPPASKGYTPSVFAELPKLLERAGPGTKGQGNITGLFTVLVEGDDHNEPVSDAVRGILDGHIVLDRTIGERGRFPAVNVLRSISRTMPGCNAPHENDIVTRARRLIATYEDMAELIRLGAYRQGSDPSVDEAIYHYPKIEGFLSQKKDEKTDLADGYRLLAEAVKPKPVEGAAPPKQQGGQRKAQPAAPPAEAPPPADNGEPPEETGLF